MAQKGTPPEGERIFTSILLFYFEIFVNIPFEKCLSGTQNDREEVINGEFSRALEPEKNYPVLTVYNLLPIYNSV